MVACLYDFDVKGKANVAGEAFSDKALVSTQNDKERHIKAAEVTASAKTCPLAELNVLTMNHKAKVQAEVDSTGTANFVGADIQQTLWGLILKQLQTTMDMMLFSN